MLASLTRENVAGISSHKSHKILLNKQMQELNVANCFEYSLLFNVKHSFYLLEHYKILSGRGYITSILNYSETKAFEGKIRERIFSLEKVAISQVKKLFREVKVTKRLQRFFSRQLILTISSCNFFFL